MTPIPLPWNRPDSGMDPSGAPRHTRERYCIAWAQQHPMQALLLVAPIWAIYTIVAPSITLTRGRADGLRGYMMPAKMVTATKRELQARRAAR